MSSIYESMCMCVCIYNYMKAIIYLFTHAFIHAYRLFLCHECMIIKIRTAAILRPFTCIHAHTYTHTHTHTHAHTSVLCPCTLTHINKYAYASVSFS